MHRCRFVLDSLFSFFFWLCSWMLQEVGYWGCRTAGGTPAPVGELSPRGGSSRRPLHPGINSGGFFQCFSTSFGTRNVCSEARGLHFCFFSCFYSDVEASVAACC